MGLNEALLFGPRSVRRVLDAGLGRCRDRLSVGNLTGIDLDKLDDWLDNLDEYVAELFPSDQDHTT